MKLKDFLSETYVGALAKNLSFSNNTGTFSDIDYEEIRLNKEKAKKEEKEKRRLEKEAENKEYEDSKKRFDKTIEKLKLNSTIRKTDKVKVGDLVSWVSKEHGTMKGRITKVTATLAHVSVIYPESLRGEEETLIVNNKNIMEKRKIKILPR